MSAMPNGNGSNRDAQRSPTSTSPLDPKMDIGTIRFEAADATDVQSVVSTSTHGRRRRRSSLHPGIEDDNTLYSAMQKVMMKKRRTARRFLQETVLYIVFMLIFCIVTYALRPQQTYAMSNVISLSLYKNTYQTDKDYSGTVNAGDWWNWLEVVLLPELHPTEFYGGQSMTAEERTYSNWYSYVVGQVRMRQVRVQQDTGTNNLCTIPKQFTHLVTKCNPDFSTSTMSTENYGPHDQANVTVRSAFIWKDADQVCNGADVGCPGFTVGKKTEVYPPTGYTFEFSRNLDEALEQVKMLRAHKWTDEQTRAVIVDVTVYNPNVRMLLSTTALAEFYPTGAVVCTYGIKPMKLFGWDNNEDIGFFVGEVILVTAVVIYLLLEIYEFYRYWRVGKQRCNKCILTNVDKEGLERAAPCYECGRTFNQFRLPKCPSCSNEVPDGHLCWKGYFQDAWNYLDLVNMAIFFAVFFLRLGVRLDLDMLEFNVGDSHLNFSSVAWAYTMSFWLSSLNCWLCFMKLTKYLDKVKALSALVRTLVMAREQIFFFFVIFLVVYIGFAMAFHLTFGTELYNYKDFGQSLLTLFLMMYGDFEFNPLLAVNRYLGPFLFLSFELLVTLIMTNMFIAIISRALGQSKEAAETARETFLSSSLKLYMQEMQLSMQSWGLMPKNRSYSQIKILINSFLRSPILTPAQLDDIRTFKSEVDHDPSNTAMFSSVLRAFDMKVDRQVTQEDFLTLKDVVQAHLVQSHALRVKVWDEDEDAAAQPAVLPQHERNLRLSNPDPKIDIPEVFKKMFRPSTEGGLLRKSRSFLKKTHDVFSGEEAVDWLLTYVYPTANTRDKALDVLTFWTRKGFIEHESLEYGFEDDNRKLYRILPLKVAQAAEESNQVHHVDEDLEGEDNIDSLLDKMARKGKAVGSDEATLGTKLLLNRVTRLGSKVDTIYEYASQLNDALDDVLNPATHGLKVLKVTVLEAKNLLKADRFSDSDPCVCLVAGRRFVQTTVKRGTNVRWDEEFVLKVRKIQEIKIAVEDIDYREHDHIGVGHVAIDIALEERINRNGYSIEEINLTLDGVAAGKLFLKMERFVEYKNNTELQRKATKTNLTALRMASMRNLTST
mmetsp:Transcript_139438/g.242507  ORF Transcript_139438/g.242507 Transcript_139438/m.242507 type:complete len:1109 (-) Transcript_139438:343-3669(-)